MRMNPYLNFNGQCEAAFKFYEKCLDGKIQAMFPHAGSPAEGQVPAEWRSKIMHAAMTIGDEVIMGGDCPPEEYEAPKGFSVNLQVNDAAEAERVFRILGEKGTVRMPIQETFWAIRFGMLTDQFGIPWMINCMKAA